MFVCGLHIISIYPKSAGWTQLRREGLERIRRRWLELYEKNENNPKIQMDCLRELRALTVTMADLENLFPRLVSHDHELHIGILADENEGNEGNEDDAPTESEVIAKITAKEERLSI
jgi:hypothetical protein